MSVEPFIDYGSVLGIPEEVRSSLGHSPEVLIRFRNATRKEVDFLWINTTGRPICYGSLRPQQYIDIRTFEGHPWIFREKQTGAPCFGYLAGSGGAANRFQIYWPSRNSAARTVIRQDVIVQLGENSLLQSCIRAVALRVKPDGRVLSQLPLPPNLVEQVRQYIYRSIRYRALFGNYSGSSVWPIPREFHFNRVIMVVPSKRLRQLVHNRANLVVDVGKLVDTALERDGEDRIKIFNEIIGKGLSKDLCSHLLKHISAESSATNMTMTDFYPLKTYFAQLGCDTAISLVRDFEKALIDICDSKRLARNVVYMLSFFLGVVNVLSYSKLRAIVRESIPRLVSALWKSGREDEAAYLSLYLGYVVLAERAYLGETESEDAWKNMLSKSMKSNSYMAILTVLVLDNHGHSLVLKGLSPDAFDELSRCESDNTGPLDIRSQFADLLFKHSHVFIKRLDPEVYHYALKSAICNSGNLKAFSQYLSSSLISNDAVVQHWKAHCFAILKSLQELLAQAKTKSVVNAWVSSLSSLFEAPSLSVDDISESLDQIVCKFTKHALTIDANTEVMNFTETEKSLVLAFNELPFEEFSHDLQRMVKITVLIFGSISAGKNGDNDIFISCVKTLAKLCRSSYGIGIGNLDDQMMYFKFADLIFSRWIRSALNLKNCAELRNEVCVVLGSLLLGLDDECDMGLMFLNRRGDDMEEEELLFRLSSQFSSQAWLMLEKNRDIENEYISEMKREALDRLLMIDVLEEKFDRVERWSAVVDLLNTTIGVRRDLLSQLLTSKQIKKLYKNCVAVITNEVSLSESIQDPVLSRVVTFFCNYFPALSSEKYPIYPILNWKTLLSAQMRCPSVISVLTCKINNEQLSDLFKALPFFVQEHGEIGEPIHIEANKIALVNCLIHLITPKISPLLDNALVSILKAFEFCANVPQILRACGLLMKVAAGSTSEKAVVSVGFAISAVINIQSHDINGQLARNLFLHNSLRFCQQTVTNDQCAVFSQLFTTHIRAVQEIVQANNGTKKERDTLSFGCAKIVHLMKQHSTFFNRIVPTIVSETIMDYHSTELTIWKLHEICDRYSTAFLTTTLPPTEKRMYSRVFPEIQRALKKLV